MTPLTWYDHAAERKQAIVLLPPGGQKLVNATLNNDRKMWKFSFFYNKRVRSLCCKN